jgi:hypothetical protein
MVVLAVLLIIAGLALETFGLWRMHVVVLLKSEQIVEGEAFNYLIHGIRGIGFVVAGASTMLLGAACLIVAAIRRLQASLDTVEDAPPVAEDVTRAPGLGGLGRRARLDQD